MFSTSVFATTELPIQNLSSVMKELMAGDTVYITLGSTTTPVAVYIIPRSTKDAGYDFDMSVTTTTLYMILHGTVRTK
jgi:hypothetical protein